MCNYDVLAIQPWSNEGMLSTVSCIMLSVLHSCCKIIYWQPFLHMQVVMLRYGNGYSDFRSISIRFWQKIAISIRF